MGIKIHCNLLTYETESTNNYNFNKNNINNNNINIKYNNMINNNTNQGWRRRTEEGDEQVICDHDEQRGRRGTNIRSVYKQKDGSNSFSLREMSRQQ